MQNSLYNNTKSVVSVGIVTLALIFSAFAPFTSVHAAGKKATKQEQKSEKQLAAADNSNAQDQQTPAPSASDSSNNTDTTQSASALDSIAPFMGSSTTPTDTSTSDNTNAASDPASDTSASSSPATTQSSNNDKNAAQAATSTPAQQRASQAEKDTPTNDTLYNKTLENILNTVVTPGSDTKKILQDTKATEARIKKEMATSTATTTSATATSTATSTIAASTGTTNGGSNEFAPSNYYIPLDNLSPQATYALSALAMVFGIVGAFLIIRDPREEMAWTATPVTEPTLLES